MNTSIVTKRGLSVGSRAELIERQFKALCLVSQTLCRAKNIEETLDGILAVLHKESGLLHGVITLSDPEHAMLQVGALYSENESVSKASSGVRYQAG